MLYLSFKNCFAKPLTALLTWLLFALGTGLVVLLLLLNVQIEQQFDRNLAGIDLVVGAKGSPLQLILSAIYHIDTPTGNIKLQDVAFLMRNPQVKTTIPQALGDSYHGFRVCGTNHAYADLYRAKLGEGFLWDKDFEVTIGSSVAAQTGLKIGDSFVSAHGLSQTGDEHSEHKYKVVGSFAPTNTVIDQLVLTSVASIWQMHRHIPRTGMSDVAGDSLQSPDDMQREITSLLVFYKDKASLVALNLPRLINQNTNMQAASPVMETSRLYIMLGSGARLMSFLGYLITVVSAFSVFIALFNALRDRRKELALMRMMGGSRRKLFTTIILEGLIMAFLGATGGIILAHLTLQIIGKLYSSTWHYNITGAIFLPIEFLIWLLALSIGVIAAVIPAWQASRTNISKTLMQ
jgi:putative ABC transport system permease protein